MKEMNILVIDNYPEFALSLKDVLELEGYQAVAVSSCQAGLKLAASKQFDLIFLDMVMPGESGICALLSLKEAGSGTPVAVISAFDDELVKKRVAELGAVAFLEKPLNIPKLRQLLAAYQI